MTTDWSRAENLAIVRGYLSMLEAELGGAPFSKAAHNRILQQRLPIRTRGAIERKHQNMSAILIGLGATYVEGYKPLGNYQRLLRVVVEEQLRDRPDLTALACRAVEAPIEGAPQVQDLLAMVVPPPEPLKLGAQRRLVRESAPIARLVDWLEREARNRSLGMAGELLVVAFEHRRLWVAGKHKLAERIEHVSSTQGDGLGYDVVSYDVNGRERFIEVKTTQFGPMTPFFVSRREVDVSDTGRSSYSIYRLYDFRKAPRLFQLGGPIRDNCSLTPTLFSAQVA